MGESEGTDKSGFWQQVLTVCQTLPYTYKLIVAVAAFVALAAVYIVILFLLFQKPDALKTNKSASEKPIPAVSGEANHNNNPGGTNIGAIVNPPKTQQENDVDTDKLKSDLGEIADFPKQKSAAVPPTMLQSMLVDPLPFKLYTELLKYNRQVIREIKPNGNDLYDFKRRYSNFETEQIENEQQIVTKIGSLVQVRFRDAWLLYLRYVMLRSFGLTKDQIEAGGNFLNYGITWEDAERVYTEIASSNEQKNLFNKMQDDQTASSSIAHELIKPFKDD